MCIRFLDPPLHEFVPTTEEDIALLAKAQGKTVQLINFSRDDAGKFLNACYDSKIFGNDPFAKLDQTGVGQLMEMAVSKAKATGKQLHYGICGSHVRGVLPQDRPGLRLLLSLPRAHRPPWIAAPQAAINASK